jgi:hypothetical protein
MKSPEMEPEHSPFGCPSTLALFLALKIRIHPENAYIPENGIPLIINDLSAKTHETTGNKPAKPETKNKRNMNRNHNTHTCKSIAGLPLITVNLFQDKTTRIFGVISCNRPLLA